VAVSTLHGLQNGAQPITVGGQLSVASLSVVSRSEIRPPCSTDYWLRTTDYWLRTTEL